MKTIDTLVASNVHEKTNSSNSNPDRQNSVNVLILCVGFCNSRQVVTPIEWNIAQRLKQVSPTTWPLPLIQLNISAAALGARGLYGSKFKHVSQALILYAVARGELVDDDFHV